MKKKVIQELLVGERALFQAKDLSIFNCTFEDGESPLKESRNIDLHESNFKWKYPLWYSNNVTLENCVLFDTARSGIWYTNNIEINNSLIAAPKTFRRANNIRLNNVDMPNALETLWNCQDIEINNASIKGDYFGFNSKNFKGTNINLVGNYFFDGGSNIEIHNSKLISKDAFWNCENVIVYDSIIYGEYLGWNSKNIKFVNCTIESLQGMCYMDNVVLENCKLINTTLAFEYSNVNATIKGSVDSVFNPSSGVIKADNIKELIMDETKIDPSKTKIVTGE